MNQVFQEIIGESNELKALQQKIVSISSGEAEAGGKALTAGVKSRLQEKKDKETEGLLDPLKNPGCRRRRIKKLRAYLTR